MDQPKRRRGRPRKNPPPEPAKASVRMLEIIGKRVGGADGTVFLRGQMVGSDELGEDVADQLLKAGLAVLRNASPQERAEADNARLQGQYASVAAQRMEHYDRQEREERDRLKGQGDDRGEDAI